jgi:hypothetical protein
MCLLASCVRFFKSIFILSHRSNTGKVKLRMHFWINILLCICGWIPVQDQYFTKIKSYIRESFTRSGFSRTLMNTKIFNKGWITDRFDAAFDCSLLFELLNTFSASSISDIYLDLNIRVHPFLCS